MYTQSHKTVLTKPSLETCDPHFDSKYHHQGALAAAFFLVFFRRMQRQTDRRMDKAASSRANIQHAEGGWIDEYIESVLGVCTPAEHPNYVIDWINDLLFLMSWWYLSISMLTLPLLPYLCVAEAWVWITFYPQVVLHGGRWIVALSTHNHTG